MPKFILLVAQLSLGEFFTQIVALDICPLVQSD